jgi:hypothetical protein
VTLILHTTYLFYKLRFLVRQVLECLIVDVLFTYLPLCLCMQYPSLSTFTTHNLVICLPQAPATCWINFFPYSSSPSSCCNSQASVVYRYLKMSSGPSKAIYVAVSIDIYIRNWNWEKF